MEMTMVPKWSLTVPSVQELASQRLDTIPSRYVRDNMNDIIVTVPSDQSLRVPLIDMSNLVNRKAQPGELQKLHSACKEWGIFQLVNHGVSDESWTEMKKIVEELFYLPFRGRERWAKKPGNNEGYGHLFVGSEEQKLEWNDMVFLKVLPIESKKLESWPENTHQFRETLVSYIEDMKQVAASIIRFMATGLEVQNEEFYKAYEEGNYDVRINIYPTCPEPEKATGIVPHIDIHAITLLQDYGELPALPVLKDDQWVFIEPIDGAIVVDLGGIIEINSKLFFNIL
ncbi:Flavonol synthase/flavanone 3-hydroxylase, putative [Ricinus communis]|uniref:Flavonol synthase/flavanone 3-hydroxylase, putative n=1 Tax=Ricinus communis TaxID=3988 RepID=B9REI6_RICCO|nr:Flavonol synthase/flavanone 3-hydroxylase, putative [Ricinus communis]